MVVGAWGSMRRMGHAQASAPLREGGAARWQERREYCALGVNGKGGGGSTAVCCRCMLAHDRLAKGLIRLLLERG